MLTDYQRRIGLVVQAARLVRGKTQSETGKQSSVSAIEGGHTRSLEMLLDISRALGFEPWVLLRIAAALPEGCSVSPVGRAKALGVAIAQLEEFLRESS